MDLEKTSQWLTIVTNIGVIAGLGLLIYELNQNTELMRAEMHSVRAEAKTERQMFLANDGDIAGIATKLFAAGFPGNQDAVDVLTPEERFRFSVFLNGYMEAVQNWHFQCQQGLLDDELCAAGYPPDARSLLVQASALGIPLTSMRRSFVADLRRIAVEAGLPAPNEDGSWPE